MKPNFALNLSHDGLSLLRRVDNGWQILGEVGLSDPGMALALDVLRQTAISMANEPISTKLVIPNSEILYRTLRASGRSRKQREKALRQELDGLTPYPLEELVFDWVDAGGNKAHVAAVARHTLQEAEEFATAYRFNPVSFVAIPGKEEFTGEPFFGTTTVCDTFLPEGDFLEPEDRAIRVVGHLDPSELATPKMQMAVPAAPKMPPADQSASPAPAPAPEMDLSDVRSIKQEQIAAADTANLREELSRKADAQSEKTSEKTPEKTRDGALVLSFASRRTDSGNPAHVPRLDQFEARFALYADKIGAGSETAAPETKDFSGKEEKTAATTPRSQEITPLSVNDPALPPEPRQKRRRRAPARKKPRGEKAHATAPKAVPPAPEAARVAHEPSAKTPSGKTPHINPREAEAARLTVFGAREKAQPESTTRRGGFALLAFAALALAAAAFGYFRFSGENAGPTPSSPSEVAALPAPKALPPVSSPRPIAAPKPAAGPQGDDTPAATASSPTDRAVEQALNGPPPHPQTIAPPAPALPGAQQGDPAGPALPSGTPARPSETQPPAPAPQHAEAGQLPTTSPQPLAQAKESQPQVLAQDPVPPVSVESGSSNDIYIASIDRHIIGNDAVALAAPGVFTNDGAPRALAPPAPPGTQFDLDPRGFVRPTPDGALSPDGVRVFAGRPEKVPPLRPGTAAASQALPQGPDRKALGRVRPVARPPGLIQKDERSRLGGLTRTELARIRPVARPPSVVPGSAETLAPTEFAVAASPRPRLRPKGFSRAVERALAAALANPQKPPSPNNGIAPAGVPRTPTRADVAREATTQNAIRLSRLNLIGVYGSPSDRRALVRLSNGRFVKVKVGDRLDGGKVAAIGSGKLQYIKRGRTITLEIPS